ncbi:MAG: phosphate ABC transporter ATP-binding protein [Planctomycetaceae bacterium]|nr:phosphate ABC transporter ATP-binding protein [Planctomycetaceae bacterium]
MFQIENLSIAYRGVVALAPVSLNLRKNAVTALIGPSGCGKTSFLTALNRLTDMIPECRVSGRIRFDGSDLYDPITNVLDVRRRIGMIFQNPTVFPMSIQRNLELPLEEHGLKDRGEKQKRVQKALEDAALWEEVKDRLKENAQSLSGGQQQRLCVARSLILEPEVILMDEPCSALDPLSTRKIEELIHRLRGDYTVIVVTHNLAQARRVADDVAFFWMREQTGFLVEAGSREQLFAQPRHPETQSYVNGLEG